MMMARAVRGACRGIYAAFDEFAPCGVWTLNAVEGRLAPQGSNREIAPGFCPSFRAPGTFRSRAALRTRDAEARAPLALRGPARTTIDHGRLVTFFFSNAGPDCICVTRAC
jgi:hypothetical protein